MAWIAMNKYNYEDINDSNDFELIMLYHENDEEAKNVLFYKYKFIIDILIKKYGSFLNYLHIDYQEVYSECNVGFSDALRSYVDNKDTSLPTFITVCIERRIKNILKKYSSEKYKKLLDSYSLDFTQDDNNNLMSILKDDNDPLNSITEEENYNELINKIKCNLTESENDVFVLMIKGFNYIEISNILNKTSKQIDNTMQRVKNKVKKILASNICK